MSAAVISKRPICLYWSEVEKWTPTLSLLRFGKLPDEWQLLPVYKFATQIDSKERVAPNTEYQMAGVKWYGEGVFHRETVLGKEQSANYLHSLKPGCIIYNRLFAWKESFAVVPENFVGFYVSNEFPQFELNNSVALTEYIYLLFTSKKVIKAVNAASIGSAAISRNRFKESDFFGFKVPIPPLAVQRKIVAYWRSAKQRIEAQFYRISKAESEISKEILASAAVQINPGERLPKIMAKRFKKLDRWGVEFNRYSWTLGNLIIGSSYACKQLSDFAWVNPSTEINLDLSDEVSFIPMESVDGKEGRITAPQERKVKRVNSGYTRFQEGDILWAKITPCMQNGKSAIANNLINGIGFGSTEFHVIRSKNTSIIKNEFIHLILRLTEVRKAAMRYFVGSAGQQRVPKDFLEGLYIPIPPLQVQLDILDKVGIEKFNIEKERSDMRQERISLEKDMEQIILGLRPVEEI